MTAYSLVDETFDKANSYASAAENKVAAFTESLRTSIFTAPTLSVTWNSIAAPTLDDLPALPSMPVIQFSMPSGQPTALDIAAPTVSISDFTEAAPTLTLPAMPEPSYGAIPSVPNVESVALPSAPALTTPAAPSLLTLKTVTFGGVDLHSEWLDRLEGIPTLSLVAPTPYSYVAGPEYASELLEALKSTLSARIAGGTGLAPAVEQAIWDRDRSRVTQVALANEAEIMRGSEAFGFHLPSGVLVAQLREAQQNHYNKLAELSRDVAIKQADLEQENLKQTIAAGMQLEGQLIDYSYKLEALSFEAAKAHADNAIQVHGAAVEQFKALLAGYQTYAEGYRAIIDGEMAKVEVYKAELDAERTKAQINATLVDQYKAQIEAGMSRVEIYRAQVAAAETLVKIEEAKIGAAGEQIRAYVAQVNAETAKIEAYKASVQAQATRVDIYKTKADVFSAKVNAEAERARLELGRYNAMVQAKTAEWDGYRVKLQAESTRIEALGRQSASMLDGYKAAAAGVTAQAEMHTKVWETQIKDYEAGQTIALQAAKYNADSLASTNQARLDAAKVGAQVYAQMTASAYSMINASASIGASSSMSVGYSYGGDVSSDVVPKTSI